MNDHYDTLETRSPDERQAAITDGIRAHIAHAKTQSPYYRETLAAIDSATFHSLSDLQQLPLTRKRDLPNRQRSRPPFGGMVTVTPPELTHIFASPGPIYEPGAARADFWRFARALYAAGFRTGDLLHNTFSYHLTPAGHMVESGAHTLGCAVIPAGVGQTELQAQTIATLQPNGYTGTPSFLKILLEKGDQLNLDLSSVGKALVSGEALPPTLRALFQARGLHTRQCYATADVGVIAYESDAMDGLILNEGLHLEIVRPGSNQPVPDGEVGEVVVTPLAPEYPLVRFATGDLSAIIPGASPCGRTNRRIKGWLGRADQAAKVRGLFIHPEQLHQLHTRHAEVGKLRLVIEWREHADQLTLHCECAHPDPSLHTAIATGFRDLCTLRADIRILPPGSLANDGKVIADERQYD